MQKLVFLIDSNENDYGSASSIGNLYLNRFTIDEDAGHEIAQIYEVEKFRSNLKKERIGMGHIIYF